MTHHRMLREVAKVSIGIFIADIACGVWLSSAGLLPITLLGISWGPDTILPGILFDAVVIALLAHYAWHMKLPVSSPNERALLTIAGTIFLVVALLHLTRVAFGWQVYIGTALVPLWLSWFGVALAGYLSYASFHFARRRHT